MFKWILCFVVFNYAGLIDMLGGDFSLQKDSLQKVLTPKSFALVESVLSSLDSNKLTDIHVHVVGNGSSGSGAWINPHMTSWHHFKKNFQYKIYLSASGISDEDKADEQAFAQLLQLVKTHPVGGQFYLMAFDSYYRKDGSLDSVKTEFHIPNEYVYSLSQKHKRLKMVASVHPYRKDAIAEVRKWGSKGVRFIKWLPNAMGINAADSSLLPFYQEMKKYNMALITHVGEEKAVEAEEDQKLGNPLLFRLPLEQGVPVVMAHCASLGLSEDLDTPQKLMTSAFSLFTRMMENAKYKDLLFADISAMTQYNRIGKPLLLVLQNQHWHSRLIQGSDYPLPAINALIRLDPLVEDGYLTKEEAKAVQEVYDIHPLLFDLVLKRFLKHPRTGHKFLDEAFYMPEVLR